MDRKELDKLFNYLPVIVATCDRYGWLGGKGSPIDPGSIIETREFFEYLSGIIPLNDIPELEDVIGDPAGAITLLWETPVDPVHVTYDSFAISLFGNGEINYKGKLESIGTEIWGSTPLEKDLNSDIIEHILFFQRKQDEQRKVQKPTASELNSYQRL